MAELYSSYERFQRSISAEEVDRVPVVPLVAVWTARNSGYDMKEMLNDAEIMAKAQLKTYDLIGCDSVMSTCDSMYFVEALGCKTAVASGGMLETKEYVKMETEEDLGNLKDLDPYKDGRLPVILEAVKIISRNVGGTIPIMAHCNGPFSAAGRLIGVEKLLLAVLDKPELVKALLDKITSMLIRYGKALIECGADFFFIPDPVSSNNMISPQHFEEFSFPYAKRFIGSLSKPALLHICGRTTSIIHRMVDTGAAILSLDQCMDLKQVRGEVGGRVTIGGNVDPINVILKGTRDDVIKTSIGCIESAGLKQFFLMGGCTIPPDTPLENLKAMVLASRAYAPK